MSELSARRAKWRAQARAEAGVDVDPIYLEGLTAFCAVIGATFVLIAVWTAVQPDNQVHAFTVLFNIVVAIGLAGMWVSLHTERGMWLYRNGDAVTFAVTTAIVASPALAVIDVRSVYPALGLILSIVSVAAFLRRPLHAIIMIGVADLVWVVCAVLYGTEVSVISFAAIVVRTNVVALMINYIRARATSSMRRQHRQLHALSVTDELTGLVNRRGLLAAGADGVRRCAARGSSVAVIYVDVDGLKQLNDSRGHSAGDAVLAEVGHALAQVLNARDTVARIGGDEFAAFVPDADPDTVNEAVSLLSLALSELSVTASIGTAYCLPAEEETTFEQLLERADRAMYEMKSFHQGRGRRDLPADQWR